MSTKKTLKNEGENKDELLEVRHLTVSAVFIREGYRDNEYA